jgi:hypothetical protein
MEKERLYKRSDDNANDYTQLRNTFKTISNLKEDLRKSLLEGNKNLKPDDHKESLDMSAHERINRETRMMRFNKPNLLASENTYEIEGQDYIKNFNDMNTMMLSGNQNDFSGINFNRSFISTHLKKDLSQFSIKQMPKYFKSKLGSDYNFKFRELETKVSMIEGMISEAKPGTNASRFYNSQHQEVSIDSILKTFEHEGRKWVFIKKNNRFEWLSDDDIEIDIHNLRLVPLNELEEKYKSIRGDLMKKEYELVDIKKSLIENNHLVEQLKEENRGLLIENDNLIVENGNLTNKHEEEIYNLLSKSDEEIRMARDKLGEYIRELERLSKDNRVLKEEWDTKEKQICIHFEERLIELKKASENEIIAVSEYEVRMRELQERLVSEENKNSKLTKVLEDSNDGKTSRKKRSDNSSLPKIMMNEIVKSTAREIQLKPFKNISFSYDQNKKITIYRHSVTERFTLQNRVNKLVIKEIKSIEGIGDDLKLKLKEKEKVNTQLEGRVFELEEIISALTNLIEGKDSMIKSKGQEIEYYESEKPMKEKTQEDLKEKRKIIVDLEAKIKERDNLIETIRQNETDLHRQHENVIYEMTVKHKKEISEIQLSNDKKLNDLSKQISLKDNELNNFNEKIERLETQIKSYKDIQNDFKLFKENAANELQGIQNELVIKSSEFKELQAIIKLKESQITLAEEQAYNLQDLLNSNTVIITDLTAVNNVLKQTINDIKLDLECITDLKEKLQKATKLNEKLQKFNDELNLTLQYKSKLDVDTNSFELLGTNDGSKEKLQKVIDELKLTLQYKPKFYVVTKGFELLGTNDGSKEKLQNIIDNLNSTLQSKSILYIAANSFELLGSNDGLKKKLQKRESELLEIQIVNEETEANIEKLNEEINQLTEALRILTKENINFKTDNIDLKENIDDMIEAKNIETQGLRNQLNEKNSEIDYLKQALFEKDKEIISYFEQLTLKDNENFSIVKSKNSEKGQINVEESKTNEQTILIDQLNQKIASLESTYELHTKGIDE